MFFHIQSCVSSLWVLFLRNDHFSSCSSKVDHGYLYFLFLFKKVHMSSNIGGNYILSRTNNTHAWCPWQWKSNILLGSVFYLHITKYLWFLSLELLSCHVTHTVCRNYPTLSSTFCDNQCSRNWCETPLPWILLLLSLCVWPLSFDSNHMWDWFRLLTFHIQYILRYLRVLRIFLWFLLAK